MENAAPTYSPRRPQVRPSSATLTAAASLQFTTTKKLHAAGLLTPQNRDFAERNKGLASRPSSARSHISQRPEPELLTRLLQYVRHEFKQLHGEPTPDERLDILRTAFELFIASFGAYSPLLTAVKHAYDEALHHEKTRALAVGDLSSRLSLMQGETQQLLSELREDARSEATTMQAGIVEREERLLAKERQLRTLELEVRNLKNELKRHKQLLAEVEERANGLNAQVDYWQAEANEARRLAEGDDSEAQKLRQALDALPPTRRALMLWAAPPSSTGHCSVAAPNPLRTLRRLLTPRVADRRPPGACGRI